MLSPLVNHNNSSKTLVIKDGVSPKEREIVREGEP
jgi:hypothetical protein